MSCPKVKARKRTLFTLILTYLFDNYSFAVIYPIFTGLILKSDILNISNLPIERKLLLLGIAMAIFPAMLLLGWMFFYALSKKFKIKSLLIFSLLGITIFFALTGHAIVEQSYILLLIMRGLAGFFSGNLFLVLFMISNLFFGHEPRHRFFGYLSSLSMVAFVFSIFMGGFFSDRKISYYFTEYFPFYLSAFFSLLCVLFTTVWFKEPNFIMDVNFKSECEKKFSFNPFRLLKSKELLHIYLVFLFLILGWFATLQFLSTDILVRLHGNKVQIMYSLISAGIIFYIGSRYVSPLLTQRFGELSVLKVWMYITSVILILCTLTSKFYVFFAFFLCTIFSASICWNAVVSYISITICPKDQGKMISLNQLITIFGILLSPILITTLGQKDIKSLYLLNSCSTIVAFFILSFKK